VIPPAGEHPRELAADGRAQVVASHGRMARVRLASGTEQLARPARRDLLVVCGDEVLCEPDLQHGELRITGLLPRRTSLYRSNARGRSELIAANVTLLLVVIAPLPEPDLFVADRYLAAAECGGMRAALLLNKCELAIDAELATQLAALAGAGYALLRCSAQSGAGLDELADRLTGETAMLVGQSGVGKSSILRLLVPESDALVGELIRDGEGRHTTTTSRLHRLPGGGALIDSPGVRDFAPAIEQLDAATCGFVEIARLAPACRFSDCAHLREPGCAVRAAVDSGALCARRYESFRRLGRLQRELSGLRRPGG
jgi:ribosome biogenesis GTPase / thiamine phosphate phosphatase